MNQDGIPHLGHNPEAFEAFYRRHIESIGRFVARRADDPHSAADLTADVFLAVIDSAHTYRPGAGSEAAWLFGIARNVINAERRRSARELRTTSRISGHRLLADDDHVRLEERIDAESAARATYRSLAALPAGVRDVLELIAVDGMTVTEAAQILGIQPVAARVRLHRARKAVRAALAPSPVPANERA